MNSAAEQHFHIDSQAAWVLAALGLIVAFVAYRWRNRPDDKSLRRQRTGIAVLAMIVGVAMVGGSYFLYGFFDSGKDARDVVVLKSLKQGGVTFEDFLDNDTERVRVSVMVRNEEPKPGEVVARCGKGDSKSCVKCEATFDVDLADYATRWPLKGGTGRDANKACKVDRIEDTSGLGSGTDEGYEGARSMYIDKIFAPGKGFKVAK